MRQCEARLRVRSYSSLGILEVLYNPGIWYIQRMNTSVGTLVLSPGSYVSLPRIGVGTLAVGRPIDRYSSP